MMSPPWPHLAQRSLFRSGCSLGRCFFCFLCFFCFCFCIRSGVCVGVGLFLWTALDFFGVGVPPPSDRVGDGEEAPSLRFRSLRIFPLMESSERPISFAICG